MWADYYRIQIARDKSFFKIEKEFNNINDTIHNADLKPGSYYFRLAGINPLGLQGPYSSAIKFIVSNDKNNKVIYKAKIMTGNIRSMGKTKYMLVPADMTYSLTSEQKDVEKILYSINGSDYALFDPEKSLSFSSNGKYKLKYYAVDLVENKSSIKSALIHVDGIPPEVEIVFKGKTYSTGDILFIKKDTKISFNAKDNVSKITNIMVSFNDKDFVNYKRVDLNMEEHKTNTIKYYAVDEVGNKIPVVERKIVMDNSAPELEFSFEGPYVSHKKDVYILSGSTKIKAVFSDAILDKAQISKGKNKKFFYTVPFTIEEKKANIEIMVSDKLGNFQKKKFKVIKDD